MPRRTGTQRQQRPSEAVHKAQSKKPRAKRPRNPKAKQTYNIPSEAAHKPSRTTTPTQRRGAKPRTATPRVRPRVGPGSSAPRKPVQRRGVKSTLAKNFPVTTKAGKAVAKRVRKPYKVIKKRLSR